MRFPFHCYSGFASLLGTFFALLAHFFDFLTHLKSFWMFVTFFFVLIRSGDPTPQELSRITRFGKVFTMIFDVRRFPVLCSLARDSFVYVLFTFWSIVYGALEFCLCFFGDFSTFGRVSLILD